MTPEEKVAMLKKAGVWDVIGFPSCIDKLFDLVAAHEREKLTAEQKPVGWYKPSDFVLYRTKPDDVFVYVPLYAAPVRTKDLTDAEIHGIKGYNETREMYDFAHAVIRAYKEKQK